MAGLTYTYRGNVRYTLSGSTTARISGVTCRFLRQGNRVKVEAVIAGVGSKRHEFDYKGVDLPPRGELIAKVRALVILILPSDAKKIKLT